MDCGSYYLGSQPPVQDLVPEGPQQATVPLPLDLVSRGPS